jgi:hypothetical protein
MLMLALLWLLAPVFLVALGVAGCFAIAIIVEGFRSIFSGKD